MKLYSIGREEFVKHLTNLKEDAFAKTFVRKADLQKQWDWAIGAYEGQELLGAIITTIGIRQPKIANLQLLHTFAAHRNKGVGRALCNESLEFAYNEDCKYFRVSAEPKAVNFYTKLGFKFLGQQKSGCQLSMFQIKNRNFTDGIYNINDPIINKAVFKKGKGGCIKIF